MGDPVKRAMIFAELESHGSGLVCLQETHLTNETTPLTRNRKLQAQFHSVYSSYSRGVSILVKKGITFFCKDVKIDTLGCYVFLYCLIEGYPFIIANLYIPPPSKLEILYQLLEYVEDKADVPTIIVGDFNMVLDGCLDRFPPRPRSVWGAAGPVSGGGWVVRPLESPKPRGSAVLLFLRVAPHTL